MMVYKPLISSYFRGGGSLGGDWLTSYKGFDEVYVSIG